MKNDKKILDEVEKTLNSFDDIPKLEGNPYLITRIKSAIETDQVSTKRKLVFSLKPVMIGLILLINILTGVFFLNADKTSYTSYDTAIQSLKYDYKITQTFNEYILSN